ncbi:guanitoxin biosynthesis L-enduracididine beta-hydroxylase GntD [Plantactinospora sp. GCM10030261]|uniref:guanitoxin biosynthesis L-enduracididine beta-hydroxylase GntD n=1 Tax=Plantactinospora sp. GCM10030261 TaxID=3273420 RepID=UPI0036221DA3
MHTKALTEQENAEIAAVIDEVTARYHSVEDPELVRAANLYAHELPRTLREFMATFRLDEPSGICLVSGFPVDDEQIGDTPSHWEHKRADALSPTFRQEAFFLLCASLLGDVFGWSTQQNGFLMHDVMPIKGHEKQQVGTGSEQVLWWHTEDAFHPFKGDYVSLMCLRNPDGVATTVAEVDDIPWAELDLEALFAAHYTIRPDESHLPKNRTADAGGDPARAALLDNAYARITRLEENPPRRPVLTGDRTLPYMCLDPYFMSTDHLDERSRAAFQQLTAAIDKVLKPVVLQPGDSCFIDNLRAVHGRQPFEARFDGRDRWLKRLNITRNLRGSREARASSAARVIF